MNQELTLFDELNIIAFDRPVYFNTTDLAGAELKQRTLKAGKLNKKVYDFFKGRPAENFTRFEVWKALNVTNPETSVGRAMTTLTRPKYGFELLMMTSEKRIGMYGAPENCWQIK